MNQQKVKNPKVTLKFIGGSHVDYDVTNFTGPTPKFAYWMLTTEEGKRIFYHERVVDSVMVEGEEELVQTLQVEDDL